MSGDSPYVEIQASHEGKKIEAIKHRQPFALDDGFDVLIRLDDPRLPSVAAAANSTGTGSGDLLLGERIDPAHACNPQKIPGTSRVGSVAACVPCPKRIGNPHIALNVNPDPHPPEAIPDGEVLPPWLKP